MRILVLTDEIFPDAVGGVGKSVYNECAALVRRGHDAAVLVRCLNPELAPEETIDGIRVIRLNGPARSSPFYYLYPLAIFFLAIRWLRRTTIPFDVLYILNPLYSLAAHISGAYRKAPIAYSFFSSMASEIHIGVERGKYGLLNPLARVATWILAPLERSALSTVTVALPRSEFSEGLLRQLCPSVTIPRPLIALGVDTKQFAPDDHHEARRQLNLALDRPILICVRRLDYRMGLQNLMTAMAEVRKHHPDVLLLIAGKGPLRGALEEQIHALGLENLVCLLGFVSEEELPLYLRAADLFVLPTEFLEGFGLATLEALSSACPVIGTPVGATPELLSAIEPLLLTDDASPEALAGKISYWLDRKSALPQLGAKCRREVEARYDIDLVARDLEQRFQGLLNANQGDGLSS